MVRRVATLIVFALLVLGASAPGVTARNSVFPDSIPVPDGFYPEGIAIGAGHDFYVGSLLDGALYKGDLRTGEGAILTPGVTGRLVAGLSYDARSGLVWGVGLDGGVSAVLIFDGDSGLVVATVPIPDGAFLNDIAVTRSAAYVTDSFADRLWAVPVDQRGRPDGPAEAVPLSGDFTFLPPSPPGSTDFVVNLNGIVATPDGGTLIANHTSLGEVYRIDPATGVAEQVDLGGDTVPSGDGLVLRGKTLYVVQNFLNQVAVVELDARLRAGKITDVITSPLFRVPATADVFGDALYLINARFDEAFPPVFGGPVQVIDYEVVSVDLR